MNSSLVIVLVVVLGAIVLAALAKARRSGLGADIYRRNDQLFSAAELRFLVALDQSIAPGHRIFGKVRLADLVGIRSGLNPKLRQVALNRIAQKHVDFVICAGSSLIPVCVIELNDSSHSSSAAKRRDEFVSSVCAQVDLPLVVVRAAASYSPDDIRHQITSAIQSGKQGALSVD